MIKNIFLKHKGKPTTASKEHCTYAEAKNIGILYNAIEFDPAIIDNLEEQLKGDFKEVAKAGFTDKPSEDQLLFDKKDISGTGTIKKDRLSFFINQSYDFLISLDTSENVNFKYILALSKANCKIGFETESYYDLLQMSLKIEDDKNQSVENLIRYLKMI